MKAQVESPNNTNSSTTTNNTGTTTTVLNGRVHKTHRPRKEEENEEIKMYLAKLQELVPFMPKHKKLSKLEVIQYVIDYIRDLRQTLGMPPTVVNSARIPSSLLNSCSVTAASGAINHTNLMDYVINSNSTTSAGSDHHFHHSSSSNSSSTTSSPAVSPNSISSHRQPLSVIPTPTNTIIPNSNLNSEHNNNNSTSSHHHQNPHHQLMDKSPSSDIDTRPVSC